MDADEFDAAAVSAKRVGITENRWAALLKMLADSGYIEGVQIYQPADGGIIVNFIHPRITLKGLEYLEENSMMKKAYRIAKGIKDVLPGM